MGKSWGTRGYRGGGGGDTPEALIHQKNLSKKFKNRRNLRKIWKKNRNYFLTGIVLYLQGMPLNICKTQKSRWKCLFRLNKNYWFCWFQGLSSRFLTFKGVSWSSQCDLDHFQSKNSDFLTDFSDFFFCRLSNRFFCLFVFLICSFGTSSPPWNSRFPTGPPLSFSIRNL